MRPHVAVVLTAITVGAMCLAGPPKNPEQSRASSELDKVVKGAAECQALIDPKQSSVFIEFKKLGKGVPLRSGEGADRIWLVMKNNTRWTIHVKAFGLPDEYGVADVGLMYEIEAHGAYEPDRLAPQGYWFDAASIIGMQPGEELRFSVPREHLAPALAVRVDFAFEWERNQRHTRHSTVFSYWDLPDGLRDRQREKKLKRRFGITPPEHGAEFQTSAIPSVLASPHTPVAPKQ